MHNFDTLFLCKLTIPKLGRDHTRDPFEHFGKIVGVGVPHQGAHILHVHLLVLQQPFGLVHAEMREISGKVLIKTLFEQLAEIGVRVVHGPGGVLHGNFLHVIAADVIQNRGGHLGHPV